MARIRYLKPDFFFDDDLAELKYECRLFFQGLWCYADKAGRLEDKPKVLKAQIMPFDRVDSDKILQILSEKFITRYEVNGRKYIQINNFLKHQKPHHTEKASTLPECNGNITVITPLKKRGNGEEEEKEEEKCSQSSRNGLSSLQNLWNHCCPKLSKVVENSIDRKAKEKIRLGERSEDSWALIFSQINDSDFCCGLVDGSKWKASYDWIMSNQKNAIKVLEGNYKSGTKKIRFDGPSN
jgi:hypothetical protein|tara:strand:+ start:300 stop:1016 length:717 start_codon:yes stop_codon:yes gene_type:complete